jgi:cytochrome c-type biogenesis protein CcmH
MPWWQRLAVMAEVSPPAVVTAPVRRTRPWRGLLRLVVVLGVALAVGSGWGFRPHSSPRERATALETQIRCPSCEDLSVAQSSSSAALAVRQEILRMEQTGSSDGQIEQALVAQYGPTILLRPATTGLTSLVWVIPAVAGATAVVALGVFFWRREREFESLRDSSS